MDRNLEINHKNPELDQETTTSNSTVEVTAEEYRKLGEGAVEQLSATGVPDAENIARAYGVELDEEVRGGLEGIEEQAGLVYSDLQFALEMAETQTTINQEQVDAYNEYRKGGPKVGEISVINRTTGQSVNLDVRVSLEGPESMKYKVFSEGGAFQAYTHLTEVDPTKMSLREDILNNDAKLSYGNEGEKVPYLFVKIMESENNRKLKGLGQNLHRIAVERSFQLGNEGRVQLVVAGIGDGMEVREPNATSAGFHESFGFLGKDVYNADGSLHHSGQSINQKLAEDRYAQGQIYKQGHKKTPDHDIHADWQFKVSEVLAYMYLPPEIIRRERLRMQEQPILQANAATTMALLEKHEQLGEQFFARQDAELQVENLGKTTDQYHKRLILEQIAKKYTTAGDTKLASEYYNLLADNYIKDSEHYGDLIEAVGYYDLANNTEKLQIFAAKAGIQAEGYKRYNEAKDFYTKAGDSDAVARIDKLLAKQGVG